MDILLIEDNDYRRVTILKYLLRCGHRVTPCSSVSEAEEILQFVTADETPGDVVIAATHGVLSDPASERLAACGAREVIVTNTLPIGEEKRFPQLTVLSIAPLLASTIRAVFENGSVTGLFDGDA